jgi:hypothetical protein
MKALITWRTLSSTRQQGKNPIKDCDCGRFSSSHLPSHAFFVDSIEETYNYDQVDPSFHLSKKYVRIARELISILSWVSALLPSGSGSG